MDQLRQIIATLDGWQEDLLEQAKSIQASHMGWVDEQRRKTGNSGQWPAYSLQVRQSKGSVVVVWTESGWYTQSTSGKKKLRQTYLRPTAKGYTKASFKKAKAGELGLVLEAEEKLAKIREELRLIGKIRGTIRMNTAKRPGLGGGGSDENFWMK